MKFSNGHSLVMRNHDLYRYDEGSLLEQRNTYFYSTFHGPAFLESWVAKRNAAIDLVIHRCAATVTTAPTGPTGQTDRWLDELETAFAADRANADQRKLLAKLIQRFEVSKRLHADYTSEFKPVEGADYWHLPRYVTFAKVLVAAYETDQKIQILNVLLKVLDTLCALRHQLPAPAAAKLPQLILAERAFVVELARKLRTRWQPC